MLIAKEQALHFINHYQELLTEVALISGLVKRQEGWGSVSEMLVAARTAMLADPGLCEQALQSLQDKGLSVAEDVRKAVLSLRVDHWVYLRDTTSYSVLMDARNEEAAYAVKCLTTRLKELVGDSGAFIECGLLAYQGQLISDGLVGFVAWIGNNYRRSFNQNLTELRAKGQLYGDRVLPAPLAARGKKKIKNA
ncbi:hypothetical protein [Comamonas composti]|uniref:hypothetical protein n=1 Tax=Comamonas composti TaxID=408558 RepID=UPI0003F6F67D|nr:hypothetical protein [Comamonas composti]